MQRIAHIFLIVVVSMLLWGLPYGLLVAALVRLTFELARDHWRVWFAPAIRLG
jgi:hypothetical protein